MRRYVNARASLDEMKLIQMGAKVEQINGKMCYVKFLIDGIEVEYVYNINGKNKYFLERIKPYKLPIKEYDTEEDVINIIYIDIKQLKNAAKSTNIRSFIKIIDELNNTVKSFEDLYLYYNVPQGEVDVMIAKIKSMQDEIAKAQEISERVFFEKEPENLCDRKNINNIE